MQFQILIKKNPSIRTFKLLPDLMQHIFGDTGPDLIEFKWRQKQTFTVTTILVRIPVGD